MARPAHDPLKYAANLIGLTALAYFAVYFALQIPAQLTVLLFHKSASLQNPIGVPEWVMGVINLVLSQGSLFGACGVLWCGIKEYKFKVISLQMPKGKGIWLFMPVFLGFGLLCNVLTTLLMRVAQSTIQYTPPHEAMLPSTLSARIIYFVAMCVAPAILEEILVRGLMQGMLTRWGPWFAILVSSTLFTLLHTNIIAMPGIFALSVVLGLCAWCTGSVLPGMILHFANNTVAYFVLLAQQNTDFAPMQAIMVYLIVVVTVSALIAIALIISGKVYKQLNPVPHFSDPKNRQSRFERLVTAPVFICAMVLLSARAIIPLFQ
ncbi:MAG: CPBP family intramembrane glutamic endopeptidase [Oscillospiraceae bacterium]